MFSLIIDTAFETCQVGLWRDKICLETRSVPGGGKHDVILAPLVQDVLAARGVTVKDLSQIIVTIGPGRFTGLRVGIAFARGLALVNNTPLIPVMTSEALRWEVAEKGIDDEATLVIGVKRGESFVQRLGQPLEQVMDVDFAATFPADQVSAVGGVLSPELKALIPTLPHMRILPDITEPSLQAIFHAAQSGGVEKNKVIRPYYSA